MFVDRARIYVKAGDGGDGCVSFLRKRFQPLGGPDGGNGGKGGDVILVGSPHMTTLTKVARDVHRRAENGEGGKGNNRYGSKGKDEIIKVPLGTVIRDEEKDVILGDITEAGQKVIVARGGKGGRGNKHFASATNQAPRQSEDGEDGEERWLILELKLLADVGLVGLPNAGKSTLLSRITSARPKVAAYPFTTLSPNLGIVDYEDFSSIVIADIPGLIEGAHQGQGLGHEFLKHIERTSVILHMVDVSQDEAVDDYHRIRKELEEFSTDLGKKPEIVAATKMDLTEAREGLSDFQEEMEVEVIPISTVTGNGLKKLLYRLKNLVEEERERQEKENLLDEEILS